MKNKKAKAEFILQRLEDKQWKDIGEATSPMGFYEMVQDEMGIIGMKVGAVGGKVSVRFVLRTENSFRVMGTVDIDILMSTTQINALL